MAVRGSADGVHAGDDDERPGHAHDSGGSDDHQGDLDSALHSGPDANGRSGAGVLAAGNGSGAGDAETGS